MIWIEAISGWLLCGSPSQVRHSVMNMNRGVEVDRTPAYKGSKCKSSRAPPQIDYKTGKKCPKILSCSFKIRNHFCV